MSDLDTQLTGLRATLQDSVEPPGLRDVADRATRRRVRNRMMVAAAVAVVAVSVAVPLLRGPLAEDGQVPPATGKRYLPTTPFIGMLDFADTRHGYAIRYSCPDGTAESCTSELLATKDGSTWQTRQVPDLDALGLRVRLVALGPSEVVIDKVGFGESGTPTRLHSTDAGRTWQAVDVSPSAVGSADQIPDGGRLVPYCARYERGGGSGCEEQSVAVVEPGSGRTDRLTSLPAFETPKVHSFQRGRWWIVGRDPDSGQWLSGNSADGREWATGALPTADDTVFAWSFADTGSVVYAVASANNGTLRGVYRSTDGGRTWTTVPLANTAPTTIYRDVVAAGDSLLIVSADGRTYRSTDGGATFAVTEARFPGHPLRTSVGYVAFGVGDLRYAVSADGVRWRELTIPK